MTTSPDAPFHPDPDLSHGDEDTDPAYELFMEHMDAVHFGVHHPGKGMVKSTMLSTCSQCGRLAGEVSKRNTTHWHPEGERHTVTTMSCGHVDL